MPVPELHLPALGPPSLPPRTAESAALGASVDGGGRRPSGRVESRGAESAEWVRGTASAHVGVMHRRGSASLRGWVDAGAGERGSVFFGGGTAPPSPSVPRAQGCRDARPGEWRGAGAAVPFPLPFCAEKVQLFSVSLCSLLGASLHSGEGRGECVSLSQSGNISPPS